MRTVKPHWQAVRKVIQYVFSFQGTPLRGGFLPTDKRCNLNVQGVFCLCRFRSLDCSYNISHNIQYVNRQLQNPRFWLAYVVPLLEKEGQRGVFYKKFSVKNSLFSVVTFCSSPLTNRPIKPLRTARLHSKIPPNRTQPAPIRKSHFVPLFTSNSSHLFRYNPQTLPTFLVTFYKKFTLKELRHIAQNAKNPLQYPKMLDKSSKKAYN